MLRLHAGARVVGEGGMAGQAHAEVDVVPGAKIEDVVAHVFPVGQQIELGRNPVGFKFAVNGFNALDVQPRSEFNNLFDSFFQQGFAAGECDVAATHCAGLFDDQFPRFHGEFRALVKAVLDGVPWAGAEETAMVAAVGHFEHRRGRKEGGGAHAVSHGSKPRAVLPGVGFGF